jgi:hypothetical protein
MFNQDYFECIHKSKSKDNNKIYSAYKTVNSMILYSLVDGSPIALVAPIYREHDLNNISMVTEITNNKKIQDSQVFQLIFNNDKKEIGFLIANLCSDGLININLMKDNKKVIEVNPFGLNKINELRPLESTVIYGDQTNENRSIIIDTYKDINKILSDDINSNNCVGSYLYVSVVPQINKSSLCDKFKSTVWKATNNFVITSENNIFSLSESIPELYNQVGGKPLLFNPNSLYDLLSGDQSVSLVKSREMLNNTSIEVKLTGNTESIKTNNIFEIDDIDQLENHSSIIQSDIGIIKHGDIIDVQTAETNIEYNYDLHSHKCIIGLSVIKDLEIITPTKDNILIHIQKKLKDIVNNKNIQLPINYNNDMCYICNKAKSDIVFYTCGHKCTDQNCSKGLDQCPVCDEIIYAKRQIKIYAEKNMEIKDLMVTI